MEVVWSPLPGRVPPLGGRKSGGPAFFPAEATANVRRPENTFASSPHARESVFRVRRSREVSATQLASRSIQASRDGTVAVHRPSASWPQCHRETARRSPAAIAREYPTSLLPEVSL